MAFKYSVVCPTLGWMGYDVLEKPDEILGAIKAAGYDGADLPVDLERMDAKAMRRLVDSLGLEIPEVMGVWGAAHCGEHRDLAGSNPQARQRAIAYATAAIDLAADLGARFVNVCAAQPLVPQLPFPELPIKTLCRNFQSSLRELCEYAAPRGISVLLEPLNKYEAYPGVLTTVGDGIRLIDDLGFENVGLQPDVFHMNIAESSICDALRAADNRIRVVHMNETNHSHLGAGHADHKAIIRTLKDCGFDGYLSIYMPLASQDAVRSGSAGEARKEALPDLERVLRQQLQFLKEIDRAVEA